VARHSERFSDLHHSRAGALVRRSASAKAELTDQTKPPDYTVGTEAHTRCDHVSRWAASITGARPSDLTDASWKHGSTDGEIFTLIRDGSKGTGMRGYAARMKPDDIWNVVNYLRTLGPKQPAKK
jgi:hypothetical protein